MTLTQISGSKIKIFAAHAALAALATCATLVVHAAHAELAAHFQQMQHDKVNGIDIDNRDFLHVLNLLLNFTNFCSLFFIKCEFFY